jgi:hypothetical protein
MHPPIIFTLHGSVDSFTESSVRRADFLSLLVEKLSLSVSIEPIIISVRAGSVIIELVFYQHIGSALLISDVLLRLKASFRFGDLDSIGVQGLTIGDEAISKPESAAVSFFVIVFIATISFLMICTLAMVAIKRRQDANKIHPFVYDKGTLDKIKPPAAAVLTVGSPAAPSIAKLPASTRATSQDVNSTAFRRILPRYETGPPSVVVAVEGAVESSRKSVFSSSSAVDKKRDVDNGFASNYVSDMHG